MKPGPQRIEKAVVAASSVDLSSRKLDKLGLQRTAEQVLHVHVRSRHFSAAGNRVESRRKASSPRSDPSSATASLSAAHTRSLCSAAATKESASRPRQRRCKRGVTREGRLASGARELDEPMQNEDTRWGTTAEGPVIQTG